MGNQNVAIVFELVQLIVDSIKEKYLFEVVTGDLLSRMALEIGNALPPSRFMPNVEVSLNQNDAGAVTLKLDWSKYDIGGEAAGTAYADEVWRRIMDR